MEVQCEQCSELVELDSAIVIKRYGSKRLVIANGRAHEVILKPKAARLERILDHNPIIEDGTGAENESEE